MLNISNEIRLLHGRGMSQVKMSKLLKCSLNTIRRKMYKMNLSGHSVGVSRSNIKQDLYNSIDSEEKAYWLGFILADGCIAKSGGTQRTIRVSLQRRDEQHLRKLAKFLGFNNKFYYDTRNGHQRIVMVFNAMGLASRLLQCGWNDFKKLGNTRILNAVPPAYQEHLLRGYFDGDGCISISKTKRKLRNHRWYANIVCKHEEPLWWFNSVIKSGTGIDRKVNHWLSRKPNSNGIYDLKWEGATQLARVLNFMYDNASIYLDRKFARTKLFLSGDLT